MGPLSIISGITTLATLPATVDPATRRRAVRVLAELGQVDPIIGRAIDRASASRAARGQLEAVIVAMGRTLLAAREVR